ncbi:MAG TPA: LysM peptidoglycan-binding domain-containing M23 family metallopeptidase [Caldilineae bacterium]|nr:LysM peptidoglycan-binding domain-containing M23 family metallopeptidase [Caldilineae bacterium]
MPVVVQPQRDDPGPEGTTVFLPFIGSRLFSAAHDVSQTDDPKTAAFAYIVQEGDALSDLAIEFGRDLRTMSCVHNSDGVPVKQLQAGDEIIIPALSDLCHRVKRGETLDKIAAWYGVDKASLLSVPQNKLTSEADLQVGRYLLIPDARSRYRDPAEENLPRPQKEGWRYGDGEFIWPIERQLTWVSQGFRHGKHMAIDLATRGGTQVRAADTGAVIKAGWSDNGYGYRIVIDHGIDYVTVYAHLSEYYVEEGDIVTKGEVIGAVGSTGNSTGPHLHFEIRDYGYLIDPLLVLPR